MKVYGYCRISTNKQNIDRQVRNILNAYPNIEINNIIKEEFTGTKIEGRKKFKKLLNVVKSGDTLVFDSVSRMSRDAKEGTKLYMDLYDKGINLVFLKEAYINTAVYKKQLENKVQLTGTNVDEILIGVNNYFKLLAAEQIKIAFDQSEKEVKDLRQRTAEGIQTAKNNGKQIGAVKGKKLTTKKSIEAKDKIKKHSPTFGGNMTVKDCIEFCKVTEKTYYKYVNELLAELQAEQEAE